MPLNIMLSIDNLLVKPLSVAQCPPPGITCYSMSTLKERFAWIFKNRPDLKAVALALGCSRKTVGRPLSLLCRDGEIERVELGVYRARSKARARAA